MKSKEITRLEEILKQVTDAGDIAEIEKMVAETKGKLVVEATGGFWAAKRPCWEMCQCPEEIKRECPAPKNQELPCWKIEGTYCKLDDYGAKGDDTSICEVCRVYKRWGEGEPIRIELRGKGINRAFTPFEKAQAR